MQHHLAILSPGWTELILAGYKTIESRFTKVRCAPFGKVNAGDLVYMKESGGPVKGQFTVSKVETFEHLTATQRHDIFDKYCHKIFAGAQWIETIPEHWWNSKHATLIHVTDVVAYGNPFPYRQKGRSAWLLLDAPLMQSLMHTKTKQVKV